MEAPPSRVRSEIEADAECLAKASPQPAGERLPGQFITSEPPAAGNRSTKDIHSPRRGGWSGTRGRTTHSLSVCLRRARRRNRPGGS